MFDARSPVRVDADGAARFRVRQAFLDRYETHQVGGRTIVEYWIPAGDPAEINAGIVGLIEVVAEYHRDANAVNSHPQPESWDTR